MDTGSQQNTTLTKHNLEKDIMNYLKTQTKSKHKIQLNFNILQTLQQNITKQLKTHTKS